MRDRYVIVGALALFVALVTSPVWYAKVVGATAAAPDVKRPASEKACVMPVEYMRTSHMDLLVSWREQVVREDARNWTAPDGKVYAASLSNSCLKCHDNKAEFCDRCHDYAGVAPSCWNCHVDPAAIRQTRSRP